jgi:hypothetical protein
LAGKNVWVHGNSYNNLGSDPGNDGEGILCQAHGGSNMLSWAVTHNKHDKGNGESGYIGGWDVNMTGALFGWNDIVGWIGATKVSERAAADVSFVGNRAGGGIKAPPGSLVDKPSGKLKPPADVRFKAVKDVAVSIDWKDAASGEAGYRVDRRVGDGQWQTIAYRPPQDAGDPGNPPAWVDYLAPRGVSMVYRVVAINGKDGDAGASEPAGPIVLESKE